METMLCFFRDEHDSAPFLEWFERLPEQAKVQCRARIGLLAAERHGLRRPAADYLRDGIYELRVRARKIHYRILYFFHGQEVVVISNGINKRESAVPSIEIERARERRRVFLADPQRHTYLEPR